MAEQVIRWLADDKIVVQVSDAGTPAVSDQGARLAEAVWQAGYRVSPVPGASAVVATLSASGLTTPRFLFAGFLSAKSGERRRQLGVWRDADYAVVLYEAPHRIVDTLRDIAAELGDARVLLLGRELTKTFETLKRLPAAELLAWVEADSNQQRGEIVLVIDAAPPIEHLAGLDAEAQRVIALLAAELPTKQAAQLAAQITGAPKKQLYDFALTLKR
jgi:16S rRNA (cytidine1402-2'-O)-methyltransferase